MLYDIERHINLIFELEKQQKRFNENMKDSCCKLAIETNVQLQDFKDYQNEQILEILNQIHSIKNRLYDLSKQKVRLEDLAEEEWDRLFNLVHKGIQYTDPTAYLLKELVKIKRGG